MNFEKLVTLKSYFLTKQSKTLLRALVGKVFNKNEIEMP